MHDNEGLQPRETFPPGLIGDTAHFIMRSAPHPNADIALAASIALLAGLAGKAFNTFTHAGLNLYILMLASTGMGKEAANSGISKLIAAIAAKIPKATTFKGPMLVSSAGLIKWLADNPSCVSVVGEFGYKLKALHSPRSSPNDELLKAVLLDLYGKSGSGNALDPMGYSDREKTTAPILSPAFSMLCESVPGVVKEALNEQAVTSGFIPRFLTFNIEGRRAQFQEDLIGTPPQELVERLAALAAHCLDANSLNRVHVVATTDEAKSLLRNFNHWITDQINGSSSEIYRELWSRAYLKALKLASLCAVAIRFEDPTVTIDEVNWAAGMVERQTRQLLAQFESGEIGQAAGNESRQQDEVLRCIYEYVNEPFERFEKYGVTFDMHSHAVFTQTYLSRRVCKLPTFRDDRIGPTGALKRTIHALLDGDEIREMPRTQVEQQFSRRARAFMVPHPDEFIAMACKKFGAGV